MESNNGNKLASFLLAGALLLSGLLVFPTAAGNPGPDLWLSDFYEPAGSPPPRADTLYEVYLAWENSGDADANGVRIGIDDEDGNQMAISDYINMGAGETGSLTLNITFDSVGETMPVAIVDYDETVSEDDEDNNEYEGWFNVEPKIGIADVWADLDIEDTEAQAGQQMLLRFSIGNSGNVSTATPVTLGLFFEEAGDEPQNWIDPTPLHYDYIQPPPPGEEGGEMMEFEWQVPQDTDDGWYEFTVIADYYENNTEDNNFSNNRDTHEICIGDCTLPDLTWYEAAQESITLSPPEAIAGEVVTVIYALANIGEGAAGPPAIVINLEVEKCPCDGSGWQQVNTTGDLRVTIGAGQTFSSEEELGLNWSIPEDGPGDWDLRIVIDPDNNLEEAREDNNNLTWYDAHEDYLEVIERKPDLRVAGVSTPSQAYAGDTIDLDLHIQQSELGNKMARDTNVRLRITDPELQEYGPYTLGPLDVGTFPDTIFFTFEWDIPLNCGGSACIGDYTLEVMVDPGNEIDEWDETNNLRNDLSINVREKLPDLIVSDVVITPVDEDGSAAVGVASTITAVVSNIGLRDMSPGEGADFEVTFSTAAPSQSVIGTTAVGIALAIGESANVSIGYIFTDLGTYKVVAEADAADDINEMDESNNEAYDILPAVTSIDGWVQNVTTTDGLSGKNHPLSFEIGFNNLPASGWQYLFFRVTVEGTGGWGDVLQLEAGENFLISASDHEVWPNMAFVNLTAANSNASIMLNWVPDKDRSDNYTITIEVFAVIDTDEDNNAATTTANIEKLTTDLLIEKMSVKDTASSVQIIVDVAFPQGEQSTLWDVEVSLKVYDWDDYAADSDAAVPRENLGTKTINGGLSRGSSWSLTFTWAREKGEFIFVAEVDPNNKVREIDEINNVYASDVEEFGDVSTGGTDNGDEEGGGLFGIPSISGLAALSLLGTVALLRRRR
jgi:subtilase family serine protease|tara:strand:- start:1879 stop:4734 length:2856 start_codon:yes stop_codon:yes gene_type:complete